MTTNKEVSGIKLSIIIPYYETLELTNRLLDVLIPQLTNEVEVIVINNYDEGVFEGTQTLFCESNGTAGKPRNVGLDNIKGSHIAFIDSDDLVSEDYIEKILNKINTSTFDYCYISWKFIGALGKLHFKFQNKKLVERIIIDEPREENRCVWNCIYKKETIGKERFNECMKVGEDNDFNLRVRKGKKENLTDIIYYYNDKREGSLTEVHKCINTV